MSTNGIRKGFKVNSPRIKGTPEELRAIQDRFHATDQLSAVTDMLGKNPDDPRNLFFILREHPHALTHYRGVRASSEEVGAPSEGLDVAKRQLKGSF